MKRTSRVLAILLALAMLFSVTAFAANTSWPIYGGDLNHTSNVSGAPTSITKEICVALTGGSGWHGSWLEVYLLEQGRRCQPVQHGANSDCGVRDRGDHVLRTL